MAAGRGTRMRELTDHTPKPLLMVAGKTLLEHQLDIMPQEVDEVIIVIGYLGDMIKQKFGDEYDGIRLKYVEQKTLDGTGGALALAKPFLKDSFIVTSADNIFDAEDVKEASCYPWAIVGFEVDDLGNAAKMVVDSSDRVVDILEVGHNDRSPGFLNTGLYCLDMRYFDYPPVPKAPGSSEYGLPQTIVASGVDLHLVKAKFWIEITAPEDLKKAEEILKERAGAVMTK